MDSPKLPTEAPPGLKAPGPRVPGMVEVSARLMARLRRDYGRGAVTDRGQALGEVAAWLEARRHGKR